MTSSQLYVGLMSGTSADAVDAVLVDLSGLPKILATHSCTLPQEIRNEIHSIANPGDNEIERMGVLDIKLGELFAETTNELLLKAKVSANDVLAIGSHGQTIRHSPPGHSPKPYSLQIGDPNTIAHFTNISTVADFRRRDIAAGGQGAPLVPAFHQALFKSKTCDRVIVNIGGMANITWLPREGKVVGFDTGPGNVLMDIWIHEHLQQHYDQDGRWANCGKSHPTLVNFLLNHPFFSLTPPKSTGREVFNKRWLEDSLTVFGQPIAPEDVQASLLEVTARSIAAAIQHLSDSTKQIYICGGGAYNVALMSRLSSLMPTDTVQSTQALGIAPEWIEAMAFAWLAQQRLEGKTGNLCAVTGAEQTVILGGLYLA